MKTIILGVGDLGASNTGGSLIKTYALGSCVALIFYDIRQKTAGMVHIALPDSSINKKRAAAKPGYFADTAVPSLLTSMSRLRGGESKRLVVKMAGGSNIMDAEGTFSIGTRNVIAANKSLTAFGLTPMQQDVGGQFSRTVSIEVDTGKVTLSSPGKENWEI